MPNVIVTNTNTSPISVLGMGPVQANQTKEAYIEEAQFAPHAHAYRTKSPNVGLVVQEVGMDVPDGTQYADTTSTQEADKSIVMLNSTDGTFVHTLLAASAVEDGTEVVFFNRGSANQATLTRAGSDHIGPASATTYALTSSIKKVTLVSNGLDRWAIG